jgi:hypothetical protein
VVLMSTTGDFAAIAVALYAAHHVGDYWVQRPIDAERKADAGPRGRLHCLTHVLTYLATQTVFLAVITLVLHLDTSLLGVVLGLLVSGGTHYIADRRRPLAWLAGLIPGKADFMKLGAPREPQTEEVWGPCSTCDGSGMSGEECTGGKCWDCRGGGQIPGHVVITDNPQLATGAWALDQSWHIFWGVFVAALIMVGVR